MEEYKELFLLCSERERAGSASASVYLVSTPMPLTADQPHTAGPAGPNLTSYSRAGVSFLDSRESAGGTLSTEEKKEFFIMELCKETNFSLSGSYI